MRTAVASLSHLCRPTILAEGDPAGMLAAGKDLREWVREGLWEISPVKKRLDGQLVACEESP